MSDIDAEVERKVQDRMRFDRVEALAGQNARSVEDLRRDVDAKLERMMLRLLEDIGERWDDKLALFRADLRDWMKESMVTREELAAEVRKADERLEAEKLSRNRGNMRFWIFVVVNTLGISSFLGTAIFWAVNTLKG